MLSIRDAREIALEHCDGDILNIKEDSVSNSKEIISWVFTIHHEDYDENVFKTVIEINKFGTILQWYKVLTDIY